MNRRVLFPAVLTLCSGLAVATDVSATTPLEALQQRLFDERNTVFGKNAAAAAAAKSGDMPYKNPLQGELDRGRASLTTVPGESIDPLTGELSLHVEDVRIPGPAGLDLVVSRSRRSGFFASPLTDYAVNGDVQGFLADWQLDLPHIEFASIGWFRTKEGGQTKVYAQTPYSYNSGGAVVPQTGAACKTLQMPIAGASYLKEENPLYADTELSAPSFAGLRIAGLPGNQSVPILIRENFTARNEVRDPVTDAITLPAGTYRDGGSYKSAAGWEVHCLETDHPSPHGFHIGRDGAGSLLGKWMARSPNGLSYTFNAPSRGHVWMEQPGNDPNEEKIKAVGRMRVFVSRISDPHGNWLEFDYDDTLLNLQTPAGTVSAQAAAALREYPYLKRIRRSDGAQVEFSWQCNPYAMGGGTSNCPFNRNKSPAAPFYRLDTVTANGRTWTYRYNDTESGEFAGRFLSSVTLPNGQQWKYTHSAGVGADASSPKCTLGGARLEMNVRSYAVEYPTGAKVNYGMTSRVVRSSRDEDGSCSVLSAVASRVVDDLDGPTATTRWCYTPYELGRDDPMLSWELAPHATAVRKFYRGSHSDSRWQDGLLLAEQVRARLTNPQCPASLVMPASDYLSQVTYDYAKTGGGLMPNDAEGLVPNNESRPSTNYKTGFPTYPDAANWIRYARKITTEMPDTGSFVTEVLATRHYGRPALVREFAHGKNAQSAGLTAQDVRATKTCYQDWTLPSGPYILGQTSYSCRVPFNSTSVGECTVQSMPQSCVDGLVAVFNEYTDSGQLKSSSRFGVIESFTYHSNGDLHTSTDPRQKATTFTNYWRGVPRRIDYADGTHETLGVNDTGTIDWIKNAKGATTEFDYDDLDRLTSVTPPLGAATTIDWSTTGRTRTISRGQLSTRTAFDGLGRWLSEVRTDTSRGESIASRIGYDEVGRKQFESYPSPSLADATGGSVYATDALGRVTRVTRAEEAGLGGHLRPAQTTSYGYPNAVTVTSFNDVPTTSYFRAFGSPSNQSLIHQVTYYAQQHEDGSTSILGAVLDFDRDEYDTATRATFGGVTRRYKPNSRRFIVAEYVPELGGTLFEGGYNLGYCRDDAGNITGKSIGQACVTANTANLVRIAYDSRGRVDTVDYPDGSPQLDYAYGATGRVEKITKGATEVEYVHDDNDEVESEIYSVDSFAFQIDYVRNAQRDIEAIIYPSGKHYALAPDAFGRPRRVGDIISSVTYHASGAPNEITFSNGQVARYALTLRNELDTIRVSKDAEYVVDTDYDYDNGGNISDVVDTVRPENTQSFSYDALNRLVATRYPIKSASVYYRGYTAEGNVAFHQSPTRVVRYSYDTPKNRLNSLSGSVSKSMGYDTYGNMTSDGSRNLVFGADGNMRQATSPVAKDFVHDGHGRILKENSPQGLRYLVYSGNNLIAEYLPATRTLTEHLYLGDMLVGSRKVVDAALADSDGDGVKDDQELLGFGK